MTRLDRLGWAEGISLVAYGSRIGIRVNKTGMLDRIKPYLPVGWKMIRSNVVDRLYSVVFGEKKRTNIRGFHLLYADVQNIARTDVVDDLLEVFESDLNAYIAGVAHQFCFVHAGVVGWKEQGIVIPGRSLSGKTTLVKEFLRRGANYYSDDLAVFDHEGLVHPFPRLLGVRQGPDNRRIRIAAELLGGTSGHLPLRVRMVVLTEFRREKRWEPRASSLGSAALALLSNSLSARTHPTRSLETLEKMLSGALVITSLRGEAEEAVDWILTHLDQAIAPESHAREATGEFTL
jgi:hypothetical protein